MEGLIILGIIFLVLCFTSAERSAKSGMNGIMKDNANQTKNSFNKAYGKDLIK